MSLMQLSPADQKRAADLRRMRMLATGLLVFAAVLYILTLRDTRHGWLGWVNAGSEAAMVGALADWFAVTAIFRHPLGIPVPHTALIKRRKDELGRSLQDFVTNNFLTPDIFRERVREAELPMRAGEWLADGGNRHRALAQGVRGGRAMLGRIEDDDVAGVVTDTLVPRLVAEPFSPAAGQLLEGVVNDKAHEPVVDMLARELHEWLRRNPEKARDVIGERAPQWTPRWLDKQMVDYGYQQALEWSMAVRMKAEHPARIALTNFLAKLSDDLQNDPKVMTKAESLKQRLLENPGVAPAVVTVWHSIRGSLEAAMDSPDSALWLRADEWLARASEQLRTDAELRATVDNRIEDVVGFLVETYGTELASVISTTVDRWDADEASDRIELFVGRDLQFIRINGTVVGALAGLLIHAISQLV